MQNLSSTGRYRSPYEWLSDLQKSKVESSNQGKQKISIPDLIDRVNDPNIPRTAIVPTSPRSVDACLRLGIDPHELVYVPLSNFKGKGVLDDVAQMQYEHFETVRKERLQLLVEERKALIDEEEVRKGRVQNGGGLPGMGDSSDMIEKERKHLESMKRRQEKEMQQLIDYELKRKMQQERAQAKLAFQQKRDAEREAERRKAEEQWRIKQRERELKKFAFEQETERKTREAEAERFHKEQLQLAKERAEEEKRKKEAYQKEQQRLAKAEQARLETERILEQQQREVQKRKAIMEQRDKERELLKEQQQKEKEEANKAAQLKKEARLKAAQQASVMIMQRKRDAFNMKEAASEKRREALAKQKAMDDALAKEREALKSVHRQRCYQDAQHRLEMRVAAILEQQRQADENLEKLTHQRELDNQRTRMMQSLRLAQKSDKVETMKKMHLYARQQLLERIRAETQHTQQLLSAKRALQDQRKIANMQASKMRQEMLIQIEKMQRQSKKQQAK